MPTYSSSMSIRFIRSNDNSNMDDVMCIRKNFEDGEFILSYKDDNNGHPLTQAISFGCRMDLVNHLYLTLKNQAIDDDGFNSVQFSLPAMPRILVNVERFRDVYYRGHFLDLLENAMDCLDRVETISTVKKPCEKTKVEQQPDTSRYYDFTLDNDTCPKESNPTLSSRRRSQRLSGRFPSYQNDDFEV